MNNLKDYDNSSKFIRDIKKILIKIEGFKSYISTIDFERILYERETLKHKLYQIVLNKFFESEESNQYLLSIMGNSSIDYELKNEILEIIKSLLIKFHIQCGV